MLIISYIKITVLEHDTELKLLIFSIFQNQEKRLNREKSKDQKKFKKCLIIDSLQIIK